LSSRACLYGIYIIRMSMQSVTIGVGCTAVQRQAAATPGSCFLVLHLGFTVRGRGGFQLYMYRHGNPPRFQLSLFTVRFSCYSITVYLFFIFSSSAFYKSAFYKTLEYFYYFIAHTSLVRLEPPARHRAHLRPSMLAQGRTRQTGGVPGEALHRLARSESCVILSLLLFGCVLALCALCCALCSITGFDLENQRRRLTPRARSFYYSTSKTTRPWPRSWMPRRASRRIRWRGSSTWRASASSRCIRWRT
jgi:hypothetical protein